MTHNVHNKQNTADKVTLNELLAPSPPPYTLTQQEQRPEVCHVTYCLFLYTLPQHDAIAPPDDTFRAMLADLFDDINRTCAKLCIPHGDAP